MKTVIITGASSGIGELTALLFARKGYNVVLAARRLKILQGIADKCQKYGVEAMPVMADVSRQEDVEQIAAKTIQKFGTFHIWVNNASSIAYGRFLDIPDKDFNKIIDTNLFGYVYGGRESLTQFKAQGYGTLINVASGYGAIPAPYVTPYVTSKFAVRGLSASLRQELIADKISNIHVCTVLPATVDTPVYQNGANKLGKRILALPPVYDPKLVAEAIVNLSDHPKAEVAVGRMLRIPIILYSAFPAVFSAVFAKYVKTFGFKFNKSVKPTDGNLYMPSKNKGVYGGWQPRKILKIIKLTPIAVIGLAWILSGRKGKIQK